MNGLLGLMCSHTHTHASVDCVIFHVRVSIIMLCHLVERPAILLVRLLVTPV